MLGVIGTYNSGCAEAMIPILGRAPGRRRGDGLPRQHADLPHPVEPELPKGEPGSLYPGRPQLRPRRPQRRLPGRRPRQLRQEAGLKKAYVLYAGRDPTSLGQAKTFRGAARKLGIEIVGFKAWNVKAKSYRGLMKTSPRAAPTPCSSPA